MNELLRKSRNDVEALGATIPAEEQNKTVLKILTKFANNYKASIDGASRHLETKHVPGSVLIVHVFENVFAMELEAIKPIENLSHEDILIAIRHSAGTEAKFIIPEAAFRDLVKTQIKRLAITAQNCANYIDIEMKKIIGTCVAQLEIEMVRFPKLKVAIVSVVENMLRQRLEEVQSMLKTYVAVEAAYVATNRTQFNVDEETQLNGIDFAGARITGEQVESHTVSYSTLKVE